MQISQPYKPISAPTDQPIDWPRLYFLPKTHYVKRQRAANSPEYRVRPLEEALPDQPIRHKTPYENRLQRFLRQEIEIFNEVCADAWAAIVQVTRELVKWLAWAVLLPLSLVCSAWIPSVSPMELPF